MTEHPNQNEKSEQIASIRANLQWFIIHRVVPFSFVLLSGLVIFANILGYSFFEVFHGLLSIFAKTSLPLLKLIILGLVLYIIGHHGYKVYKKIKLGEINSSTPWHDLRFWFTTSLLALAITVTVIAFIVDCLLNLNECNFQNFYKLSKNSSEILIFSLALIGASATLAISLWRGGQINEQIQKAEDQIDEAQKQVKETQRQSEQMRFQTAVEMATEKDNAGRAAAGFRVLESVYDIADKLDQEVINSVALYALSINKEDKNKPKVSMTVRQWALDILISRKFLCYESHKENEEAKGQSMEISISNSTIEKDFSRLNFTRKLKGKDRSINFSGFSFRECDFSGANLSDINFSNADFTGAKLHGVNLCRANLTRVRGLAIENLVWAYFYDDINDLYKKPPIESHPLIKIRGWEAWVSHVQSKLDSRKLRPKEEIFKLSTRPYDIPVEVQNFLASLTLAVEQVQFKMHLITSFEASCDPEIWKDFIRKHDKSSTREMQNIFGYHMTAEVWSYLKYITQEGRIEIEEWLNQETVQLELKHPRIKSWLDWKFFIREAKDMPEGIDDEAWYYMRQLAEEDAPYPPGVVGDDENEGE